VQIWDCLIRSPLTVHCSRNFDDPFGQILGQQETVTQPFKYVGQYGVMAEPNGLYHMRARYYDPNVGRFISEDPLGFGGGDVNLYAYARNNPVMLIDPFGLAPPDRSIWFPFEQQLGQLINTGKNYTAGVSGRIVDYITEADDAWEAKSGAYVYLSPQIRGFLEDFGNKFRLVVSGTAGCSKPLTRALTRSGAQLWQLTETGLSRLNMPFIIVVIDPKTGQPIGYYGTVSPEN
jgi:RHS repeat-associated protein